MPALERLELERLLYQQGQLLRSRDFRDQKRIEEQLRWWHNRALHQAYGIAGGMEARFAERAIVVRPGIAYDCAGREVVLAGERRLAFPKLEAGATALFASYPDTLGFRVGEAPRDGVPVAVLYSVALAAFPPGATIPDPLTGQVAYDADGKLLIALGAMSPAAEQALLFVSENAEYRKAVAELASQSRRTPAPPAIRALARPHIGYGSTIPGSTQWDLWIEELDTGPVFLGFQVSVDTSAAGFTKVPCYFASLATLVTPFEHIENTSIGGFTFRFVLPGLQGPLAARGNTAALLALVRSLNLSICWMGIQHEPGPQFTFAGPEVNYGCA